MGEYRISGALEGNVISQLVDFTVDQVITDAATEAKETSWTNTNWSKQLGYYKKIGILKRVINAKATWTVGKGFIADDEDTFHLQKLVGWGKDSFNTILENMIRTMLIGGDSYAEIIRDEKGEFINLKTLDPGSISIIVDSKGMILRYEQNSKIKGKKPHRFEIEQIFHFCRNRVADEIHGDSLVDALEAVILRREEAKDDWKRVLHMNIDPMMIWHLDTDDPTKIAEFKTKVEAVRGKGENMYIPKDAVVPEQVSIAPNSSLNPLAWIVSQDDEFYEESGVPRIIVGGTGGITEAAVKIAYLAFQQTIEEDQLYIEEMVASQLGMTIELEFPASLENELLSDNKKDGAVNIDPSETTAGQGQ